jgi:hypothetical protein
MKLDRFAFDSLKKAFETAERAPGDGVAHSRFASWAQLVSRIVRRPFVPCGATDVVGRFNWRRTTALALFLVIGTNFGLGVWQSPGKPINPAPPRAAIVAVTSTSVSEMSTIYRVNATMGREIRAFGPTLRRPATKQTT